MATNLAIDDGLIVRAKRLGRFRTKKEAVTAALQEYIARRSQLRILEMQGTVDYDPDHNYKKLRRLR